VVAGSVARLARVGVGGASTSCGPRRVIFPIA
jgi:hypothetical protein